MSTLELKNSIISKINTIEDEKFLKEIIEIINGQKSKIIILDEFQLNAIEAGIEQINNGNYIKNDKLNSEIEKWLLEK